MPLAAQIQARRIAETNKTLAEAREAIIGYAMSHIVSPISTCTCQYLADSTLDALTSTCTVSLCPTTGTASLTLPIARHYLPCPDLDSADPAGDADGDGSTTDINNGLEDRKADGSCSGTVGNFPWVTLGVAAQDAWGNRLHYSLTNDPDDPLDSTDTYGTYGDSSIGFSNLSRGNNNVCLTGAGGCSTGTVASNVPVVLVSYGSNGWGAWNINGTRLKEPTSVDELENTDADPNFVSRAPTKAGSDEFDDLVVWLSHDMLTSRVCPSGGCP